MDMAYLYISAAFAFSALIAYLTGRMWGALLPPLGVAIYVSAGTLEQLDWFISLFLFAFIGYGMISFAGARLGVALHERRRETNAENSPNDESA